ncbi:MAG: universal stress protein [Deltaproteobacteria bacterium]|nr:universal stress protein [Deltaproteobacteria bacterium]
MPWKTILVPHDFSSCANHAAALARDVARATGARLILAHVAEIPTGLGADTAIVPEGGGAPIKLRDYALTSASERLEDIAARLRKDDMTVSITVVMGGPVDEILRAATDAGADLIVMGTHGRTGLRHLITGSVTEKVVRHASVPVLTVRVPDAE